MTRNMEEPGTTMSVNCTPLELLGHSTAGLLNSVPNVAGGGKKGDTERWREEKERDRKRQKQGESAQRNRDGQTDTDKDKHRDTEGVRD